MKDAKKKEMISAHEIGVTINNRENGLSSMQAYLRSWSRHKKKASSAQGFTLIELLVVLVIIAILASYIAPKIIGRPEEAKRTMAAVQIQGLETALKVYKLDNGMYPSTDQGLSALIEPPTVGKLPAKWKKGGYLEKGKVPKDPWGNEFIYLCPGVHGDFDLSSRGADGESGGEEENADLNNWELEK